MSLSIHGRVQRGNFTLDLNEEFHNGEVVAVVGPNGTGKSTLLHLVAGLVRLHEGSLVWNGVTCDEPGQDVYVQPENRSIGMMFQGLHLIPQLTAAKNVELALQARKVPRAQRASLRDSLLSQVSANHLADRKTAQLSGGEGQRVALARALAGNPEVLLLDEPLSAIDADSREQLRLVLGNVLKGFPGVVLLVSHDPADIESLATRTVTLGR
jgi:molybdate transport system ATP-binding protein